MSSPFRSLAPTSPRMEDIPGLDYRAAPLAKGMQFQHIRNWSLRATTPITPRIIGTPELDYRAVPLDFPIYPDAIPPFVKHPQTISFANPGTQPYAPPLDLVATATSGLPVTFMVVTGPATLAGTTLTFSGLGWVTVRAYQNGNAYWAQALAVPRTFLVFIAPQTITFVNPGAQLLSVPLDLVGSASSGLTVTYTVDSGPATVLGSVVTFTGLGPVTITAHQAGNAYYSPATPVSQTFSVASGPATLEGRIKGGSATLCGHSEFGTPSTPPKKYLSKAKTGTMYQATWNVTGCPQDSGFTVGGPIFAGSSGGIYDNLGSGPYDTASCSFYVVQVTGGYKVTFVSGNWSWAGHGSGSFNSMSLSAGPGGAFMSLTVGQTSGTLPGGNYGGFDFGFSLGGQRYFTNDPVRTTLAVPFVMGAAAANSIRDVWNYSSVYSPTSGGCGSPTVTDTSVRYQQSGGLFPLSSGGTPSGSAADPDSSIASTTTTKTDITINGSETCVKTGSSPDVWSDAQGATIEQLTNEDTESDAITRLLAGSSWSAWAGGIQLAQYEQRTSGFSFAYQDAEYRARLAGLTPLTTYNADIQIYRRVYGTGAYVLYQVITISGTTDGGGNFSEIGSVPNDPGYQTYAYSAIIYP